MDEQFAEAEVTVVEAALRDGTMSRVNITYNSLNSDLPDPVGSDATDAQVRQWVTEALRAGIPGMPPEPTADISDFVVDRFPPSDARPYGLLQVRPKVPFGA